MVFHRATLNNVVLSWIVFVLIISITDAEITDVSLSLSVKTSKSYDAWYRVGRVATIHNVTVSGRLVNTTSELGIVHQDISIYYKNVSERFSVQDMNWVLINITSTDTAGYYSYVWVPSVRLFFHPEEHEVLYQVKVVWEYGDFTVVDSGDVYISSLEYERPPYDIYLLQPFLVTGLFLSGAAVFSIVIFKKFGGTERIREKTRFDRKTFLYFVLSWSLCLAFLGLSSLFVGGIPVQWHDFLSFLPYVANPFIILLLSILLFLRYLRRGNKLKTVLSSMVITWAALLILILLVSRYSSTGVSSLFFPPERFVGMYAIYAFASEGAIVVLFFLLLFVKKEKTV